MLVFPNNAIATLLVGTWLGQQTSKAYWTNKIAILSNVVGCLPSRKIQHPWKQKYNKRTINYIIMCCNVLSNITNDGSYKPKQLVMI